MNRETLKEVKKIIGRELDETVDSKEVNVPTVEVIEELKKAIRTFAVNVEKLDDNRDLDISIAKQKYSVDNEEHGTEKKDSIIVDYRIQREALAEPVYKYLDSAHEYLTDKIENTAIVGEVTTEALNDIEILKQLEEIDKEDLQIIVRKHEKSPLVIQLLSEIGEKHKYYFEAKDPKGCVEIPNEVRIKVKDLLENYESESCNYAEIITDSNNWLDQMNTLIDSYVFGDIEVRELTA